LSTTISGNLGQLTRTGPERVAVLDWALATATRLVSARRGTSTQLATRSYDTGMASDRQLGHAYNEEAFRYFLSIEQKRTERSGNSFLLLLVNSNSDDHRDEPFSPAIASKLFAALQLCVRDTDFTGWYNQGFVAGAVLTQVDPAAEADINRIITERVVRAIASGLPASVAERLDVRIVESAPCAQS
jgi:hypothetical protein